MMEQHSHSTFTGLGIAPKILETLHRLKFTTPTPIQHKAIPPAVEGKDVMGIAQTGTGKTLAFGIPTVQRLAATGGRALVIVPTRELAQQVDETMHKIAGPMGMRTAVLIGGASMNLQRDILRRGPRILIATPGRLNDHLEQRNLSLADVKVLILDEADRMLDMGFAPQIERIVRTVPKDRQTLLFSATMPAEIVKIATAYMHLPLRIEIARAGTAAETVEQELFIVKKEAKRALLEALLREHRGSVLLFTRTKILARKVARAVRDMGHTSAEIHANRSLNQRKEALDGFKSGKYRVLVATDIAARGIDVKGIEVVINYDLPDDADNYVHRIGRTGRAGMTGRAISMATPEQGDDVRAIERLTRLSLRVSSHPQFPEERFTGPAPRAPQAQHRHSHPQHRRGGHSQGQHGRSHGHSGGFGRFRR